ncbi:MAG: PAS domain S-box protein, partial [Sphingomonas sp.]|nr:PAS domain S-box protein [Sphingomonas sp.]
TEQRRSEAALRESEARLAAALEGVPLGVAVMDTQGATVVANAEIRRFLPSGTLPSRDPAMVARWRGWDAQGGPLSPDNFPGARALRGERVIPGQEMLFTDDDGREIWTSVTNIPLRDSAGMITGLVGVIDDIDDRKRALETLRESEERHAFLLKFSDALRPLVDAAEIRATAARVIGQHLGASRTMYAEIEGEGDELDCLILGQYVGEGQPFPERVPYVQFMTGFAAETLREDGLLIITDVAADPRCGDIRDAWLAADIVAAVVVPLLKQGREVALFGVNQAQPRAWTATEIELVREAVDRTWDAVQRARAEAALRGSEKRLRQFGEASQDILWTRDAETLQWMYLTPAFETIYGLAREDAVSGDNYRSWQDLIEPGDREEAQASIERVRAGEQVTFEYCIRRPSDGETRWIRETDFPITDAAGHVTLIGGVGHDATDLKRAKERQETLLAELQHRVRNILAVTQSIVSRSDDGERSAEDYVQHLQGRIAALARTQVLLTRRAGAGVNLEELIRDELLAQAASEDLISIDGAPVELSPKAAEVLTLAIHELATNATKYGAFSGSYGNLAVSWHTEQRELATWLVLRWRESGVPVGEVAPRRRGFGAELISKRIPYELKGKGSFELKPGGLESRIEFPLLRGESILQTSGLRT